VDGSLILPNGLRIIAREKASSAAREFETIRAIRDATERRAPKDRIREESSN